MSRLVPGDPVITPRTFLPGRDSVRALFAREVGRHGYYGHGKVALRDGLRRLGCTGAGEVLVPASLPPAVVEPMLEIGLEPRCYAVEPDFGADVADLEARIGSETVAVLAVHYFGFAQPKLDEIRALADEHDLLLVDDNAHSALSRRDGRLLGTFGDMGFTSLHKLLPMPDGAILFGVDDGEPGGGDGPAPRLDVGDVEFLLSSVGLAARCRSSTVRRLVGLARSGARTDAAGPSADSRRRDARAIAAARYERARVRMSRLSWHLAGTLDPTPVVTRRRANYRAWLDTLDRLGGPDPLHESLPRGVCPQVVPVVFPSSDDARRFVAGIGATGVRGVHRWPRLRPEVVGDPDFATAADLAERLVVLPCHQSLSPGTIEDLDGPVAAALGQGG